MSLICLIFLSMSIIFWGGINYKIFKSTSLVQQEKSMEINWYMEIKRRIILKSLFLTFLSMNYLMLKKSSLRNVCALVLHVNSLIMMTVQSILNGFTEASVI